MASVQESPSRAGPSRPRPPPIPIPAPRDRLAPSSSGVRPRTPTRASTNDQEVELGVYLALEREAGVSCDLEPASPLKTPSFHRRPSGLTAIVIYRPYNSLVLHSHARVDSALGQARITHVQARKSRRPPFLHEYILVFFTTVNDQRFVARIDRLGKIGSTSGGGLLGWCAGRHGQASDTAIQQVGVYYIQDAQIGIDSPDGAWYAHDGGWGSDPIATLIIWSDVSTTTTQVSHHIRTAMARDGPTPQLGDVSRLLEAILLEMPTYHLTTTNCYFMTRSSLLLLQRCFPDSFACFMGSASGELVASSDLAEPVWAGLLRWYLPFVIMIFLLYFPLVILGHFIAVNMFACRNLWACPREEWSQVGELVFVSIASPLSRISRGLLLAMHGLID
ncbi:hypothetical protein FRC06_000393, partial [Ceratobasidium sp. 370]